MVRRSWRSLLFYGFGLSKALRRFAPDWLLTPPFGGTSPSEHHTMSRLQYNPKQSVTIKYAYSRVGRPQADVYHMAPALLKAVHETFKEARSELKASDYSTLFVAMRANGNRDYVLGRYLKDKLGRVRWYDGWPASNGLLQITDRKPFS